nr:Ger(x)C family spore germination C-terminal domain-containing protein [Paenibacillus gorillae]
MKPRVKASRILRINCKAPHSEFRVKNDTYIGVEVTSSNASIESKVVGGKPEFTINIRSEGNIVDRGCRDVDIADPATIEKLQIAAGNVIRDHCEAAVKKAKEMKSDFLGFGNQLQKDHPSVWQQVKTDWNDTYLPDVKIQYKIKLLIRKTGTTGNTTLK